MDLEVFSLCLSIGASIATIVASVVAIAPTIRRWLPQKNPEIGKDPISSQDQDDLVLGFSKKAAGVKVLHVNSFKKTSLAHHFGEALSQKIRGHNILLFLPLSKTMQEQVQLVCGSLKKVSSGPSYIIVLPLKNLFKFSIAKILGWLSLKTPLLHILMCALSEKRINNAFCVDLLSQKKPMHIGIFAEFQHICRVEVDHAPSQKLLGYAPDAYALV